MVQGLGPDGDFVVQCTQPAFRTAAALAQANAITTFAEPTALAGPTDGYPMTPATGAEALTAAAATPEVLAAAVPEATSP
jgi:hypothetical protein